MENNHVVWHNGLVTRDDRYVLNNHKSGLIWLTGLSASGKSTIANHVEKALFDRGIRCYVLDGDNVRHGLNSNLGFSPEDRKENIRRIAEVGKLMVDAGLIVLTAFISPYREDRNAARQLFQGNGFMEVFVKCSLPECECRDPKGLYKKARAGIIKNYTGIDAPYEEPEAPELIIDTEHSTIQESVAKLISFMGERGFI